MDIGLRLKRLREGGNLSLRALSRKTGIAVSFLSAVERGRHNVSVAKLKMILDALGVTLGEFFSQAPQPRDKVVYRAEELVEISGQRGVSFREVAAGRPGRKLQFLIEEYAPGGDTGSEGYRHGADEAGVVLKGTLELTVDGEVYVLKPGDTYYFDSCRSHRFRNVGKGPAEAVSANTPPSL